MPNGQFLGGFTKGLTGGMQLIGQLASIKTQQKSLKEEQKRTAQKDKELTQAIIDEMIQNVELTKRGAPAQRGVSMRPPIPGGVPPSFTLPSPAQDITGERTRPPMRVPGAPARPAQPVTSLRERGEVASQFVQTGKYPPGYEVTRKGEMAGGIPKSIMEQETKQRDKFLSLTKDYRLIRDSYSRVQATPATPAGDLALIFNYMKILDPGSVVRESEFQTAATAGSFGEQTRALVGRLLEGTKLSPKMRDDFKGRAKDLYQVRETQYKQTKGQFTKIAKEYGIEPSRVVIEVGLPEKKKPSVMPIEAITKPTGEMIKATHKTTGMEGTIPVNKFNPAEWEKGWRSE